MKIPLFAVLLLALLTPLGRAADTEKNSLQVTVKDAAGKPAASVQLLMQNLDARDAGKQAVSDSAGRAVFRNVAPGTYKISAFEKRTPSAAATMARVGSNSPTTVTLALAKMMKASNQAKKHKRYVYVAGETGSHIGGGRWVEVDDDSSGTGASAVDKRGAQMLNQPQSFGLRAFQGPSN
jgi:hypothetical protein